MPFPRASQALSRFTVLDLTRVRAGPTCVRQLADWGANVIKIEMPPHLDEGEGPGGPREGSDFQNLHRNKRGITLNLKSPQGARGVQAPGREGRRRGRELPPRREGPPRHRLRGAARRSTSASSRQHLRLRPGRALSRPAGLRPDRAGHGRADVDHRRCRARARCASASRSPISPPACSARIGILVALLEREVSGEGPVGHDLAAAGADLHARLPGRALANDGRGRQAGRQQSSDLHPDRRVQDHRRPHQHRRRRRR